MVREARKRGSAKRTPAKRAPVRPARVKRAPPKGASVSRPRVRRASAKGVSAGLDLDWRRAHDAIAEALCLVDPHGSIVRANERFAALVGRTPEEVVGQGCCALIHGGKRHPAGCPLPKALKVRVHQETEYAHGDRWVRAAVHPLFDQRGRLAGAVQILSDITEQKRSEEALRESEERYRHIINALPDPVFVKDEEHRWIVLNDAYCRLMGYRRDELIGKSDFDFFPHEEAEVFWAKDDEVFASGGENINEEFFTDSGGRRKVISTKKSVYRDSRTGKQTLVGVIRDVTAAKRVEEELHRHRGHLEDIVRERTKELEATNERLVRNADDRARAEELQSAIYEISEAAHHAENLDQLYASIHKIVGRLMDAENLYIALYDPVEDLVSFPYFVDSEDETPQPRRGKRGRTEYILRTGKPLLVTLDGLGRLVQGGEIEPIGAPSIDWLGVPLIVGNTTIGVLAVQSYTEGIRYREREKDILTFVSRQVADAIGRRRAQDLLAANNERLVREAQERAQAEELRAAIYEISEAANQAVRLGDLYASIHRVVGRLMDAKNLYIALYDPAQDLVSFPYYVDSEDETPQPRRGRRGRTEYILRTGKPLLMTPELLERLVGQGEIEPIGAASIDWLGVPLKVQDRIIGVLAVQSYVADRRYTIRDEEVLSYVSARVAEVIERKRAEEALQKSEERYRTILRDMVEGYYELDLKGNVVFSNEATVAMLGFPREELIGLNYRAYMSDAEAKKVFQVFNRVFLTGEPTRAFDWELIRKDGAHLVIEASVALNRGADGQPVGFRGVIHDVTERKRAEEALRASERRFRDFVEHALAGVYRTTPDGRVLMANSAAARMLGFPSAEAFLQADLEEWAKQHGYPRARLKEALARDDALTGHESTFTRDDGSVAHLMESARAVRDATGEIQYYEGTIEDMTEHRRLEEQVRQAQKMEVIGTLAGGVAHDFNNLLQAMLSHIQLLRRLGGDPAKMLAVVRELEQHISRGASLTRQLLVFSRRETVKRERMDLNDAVRVAVQVLQRLIRANIALSTELAPERLLVEADRGQLEQVLMNLTLNASDAMPQGGRLVIRTGASDHEQACLSVQDTGHGVADAIRARIFEPFFTTKEAGRGTGLGLSVVHGIVASHGGRIELESEVGKGSTFTVVLPRVTSGESAPVEEVPEVLPELAAGKGERILVVEDEDGAREGLRDILTSLGYEVVALSCGESAAELPAIEPFQVLLTDLMLPGVAGPELARQLQERWPALRVVLMSGYTEDEAVRRSVATGSVRFLQKPFDMTTLAREVRAALDDPPISRDPV